MSRGGAAAYEALEAGGPRPPLDLARLRSPYSCDCCVPHSVTLGRGVLTLSIDAESLLCERTPCLIACRALALAARAGERALPERTGVESLLWRCVQ